MDILDDIEKKFQNCKARLLTKLEFNKAIKIHKKSLLKKINNNNMFLCIWQQDVKNESLNEDDNDKLRIDMMNQIMKLAEENAKGKMSSEEFIKRRNEIRNELRVKALQLGLKQSNTNINDIDASDKKDLAKNITSTINTALDAIQSAKTKECKKCHFKNKETAKFCGNCGNKFSDGENDTNTSLVSFGNCPKCNAPIKKKDQKFCGNCGNKLTKEDISKQADLSQLKKNTDALTQEIKKTVTKKIQITLNDKSTNKQKNSQEKTNLTEQIKTYVKDTFGINNVLKKKTKSGLLYIIPFTMEQK